MKIARMIRASTMPIISAVCWYSRGTANFAMMMMKMNRLSMERLYSVSQPAKNSGPGLGDSACGSAKNHSERPKITARPTYRPSWRLTSFIEGSWGRRPMISRSTSRTPTVTTMVIAQTRGEATESPMMAFKELAPPEWRAVPAHVRAYASRTGTPEVSSAHPVAR